MTEQLEFVNDWSELEAAVARLAVLAGADFIDLQRGYNQDEDDDFAAMACVAKYVPRLLTQYASLLETSFALTGGWEQHAAICPLSTSGLYLPDHG